jgi:hypothetical protein
MKILLEQEGKHLVMQVVADKIINGHDWAWDTAVKDMTEELDGRRGVRRMSYDTWHWDERRHVEAEQYITYFYLKHE